MTKIPIKVPDFESHDRYYYINNTFYFIDNDIESPYIYYIEIEDVYYFKTHSDVGFSNLNETIKNDVRNGKCSIVMYARDEGIFGSEINWELETLDSWIISENFPHGSVHFICMNLLISESVKKNNFNIIGYPTSYNSETYLMLPYSNEDSFYDVGISEYPKLFLSYNKSNQFTYRIYLMLSLIKNKLVDSGLVSFSKHLKRSNLEHFIGNHPYNVFDEDVINTYNKITPMYIDDILPNELDDDLNTCKGYEEFNGDIFGQGLFLKHYSNSFLSLVSETLVLKDTVYLSEKTFKPIAMGHPFISISSRGTLKKIKELGYKTFDRWWDESYDECDEFNDRIDSVMHILNELNQKSNIELINMRKDMLDILIHNQKLYLERRQSEDSMNSIMVEIHNNML